MLLVAALFAAPFALPFAGAGLVAAIVLRFADRRSTDAALPGLLIGLGIAAVGLAAPASGKDAALGYLAAILGGLAAVLGGLVVAAAPRQSDTAGAFPIETARRQGGILRLAAAIGGASFLLWAFVGQTPGWLTLAVVCIVIIELTGDAPRSLAAIGLASGCAWLAGFPPALSGILAAAAIPACAWPPSRQRFLGLLAPLLITGVVVATRRFELSGAAILAPGVAAGLWLALPDAPGSPHRTLPPSWSWFVRCKLRFDPVYRQLLNDPRPWGRIVDAGCGFGLGALVAARRSGTTTWTGIDLDQRKLLPAARICGRLTFPCSLHAAQLPVGPAVFPAGGSDWEADTILALDILHYWSPAAQAALLVWLARRLAFDGRLWLSEALSEVPGAGRISAGERFTTAIGLNPRGPLRFVTGAAMADMIERAGLHVLSCRDSGAANRLWELRRQSA